MTNIGWLYKNTNCSIFGFMMMTLAVAPSPVVVGAQSIVFPQKFSLAVVGPLTTSSKAFGIPHLQGITLAVEEYNEEHPSPSKQLEIKIFDDQADPSLSASIAKQLFQSGVLALLGPANSSSCGAVISELKEQHIRLPIMSALCSATDLTTNMHSEFFFEQMSLIR